MGSLRPPTSWSVASRTSRNGFNSKGKLMETVAFLMILVHFERRVAEVLALLLLAELFQDEVHDLQSVVAHLAHAIKP